MSSHRFIPFLLSASSSFWSFHCISDRPQSHPSALTFHGHLDGSVSGSTSLSEGSLSTRLPNFLSGSAGTTRPCCPSPGPWESLHSAHAQDPSDIAAGPLSSSPQLCPARPQASPSRAHQRSHGPAQLHPTLSLERCQALPQQTHGDPQGADGPCGTLVCRPLQGCFEWHCSFSRSLRCCELLAT